MYPHFFTYCHLFSLSMSVLLSSCFSNMKSLYNLNHYFKFKRLSCKKITNYTQKFCAHTGTTAQKFVPFINFLKARRAEAKCSILVQVQAASSYRELYTYCEGMGTVKNMFHYTAGVEPMHFIIVEFSSEEDVKNVLLQTSYLDDNQIVPVHSTFLWFRASSGKSPKLKLSQSAKIDAENGTRILKDFEINEALQKAEDVSDQMRILHNITKLSDIGTRLRFLTAKQIESALLGMFPYVSALPFGSSVNGFGKMGCDLDLVLRLSDNKIHNESSRLVFHCKASTGTERSTSQRHMETIGDLLQLFLPGCSQVRRILQARVPIIKYHQQLTDVECDVSMANMSGVHMSDFLYMMGALDDRVRPLVFTIRKWASETGITNTSPGRWLTNFSLTLLVLAFLQKPPNSPPVLPSLNTLIKLARPQDEYITDEGLDCTFLRNIDDLQHTTQNKDSLASLLKQFFEFYSQYDFTKNAVCLNEAVSLTKPDYSALYIVNPLERGLNVSKNVSFEEIERFQNEVRTAAWTMETQENKAGNWGILTLFTNTRRAALSSPFGAVPTKSRLMDVTKLFEDEADSSESVEYKNETVKKQVQSIKRDTRQTIKAMEKRRR